MKKTTKKLTDFITPYLEYCEIEKGLSNKTQENYALFLKKFTDWLSVIKKEDIKPHELTDKDIWNYRLYLAKQKSQKTSKVLTKHTQIHYLVALRNLLTYFTEKDIQSIPRDKIKLPKRKMENVKFLTLKQLEKLLLSPSVDTLAGLRDRAILETLFSTGLRVSELVALQREQLDIQSAPKDDFFELPIVGKGGVTRTVYFSPRALNWIHLYLQARDDTELALFINLRGPAKSSRRLTTRSVEQIVQKYAKMAGIQTLATPHTIRHSYATDLLSQGVDLRLIQEFLGHKNIVTTQIYTHVVNKQLRDVHKKFHSGDKLKDK